MTIKKAYKFRLKIKSQDIPHSCVPDSSVRAKLERFGDCTRFVWNKALALQKERLDNKEYCFNYYNLAMLLPKWKEQDPFLWEGANQNLQQKLMDLTRSLKEAFNKKKTQNRFPKFKKRGYGSSFRFSLGSKRIGNTVYLPKIGWIPFFKNQPLTDEMDNCTIRQTTVSNQGKNWYVSFSTTLDSKVLEIPKPKPKYSGKLNITIGPQKNGTVKQFALLKQYRKKTISIPKLDLYANLERKLAKAQHKLARKVKDSKNYHKQLLKNQKAFQKIYNKRQDFLNKLSTNLCKQYSTISINDLTIQKPSYSASSSPNGYEEHSKASKDTKKEATVILTKKLKKEATLSMIKVLQKTILDQGWYAFRRQLTYKKAWKDKKLIVREGSHEAQGEGSHKV